MTTRLLSLSVGTSNVMTTSVATIVFIEIVSTLKTINTVLKGHMINRILLSWSFHMKFIKLAEISYEMTNRAIFSINCIDKLTKYTASCFI